MKQEGRTRRHRRVTKRIQGSPQRPRMVVFRTGKHMYVQLVDDTAQKVMTGMSTLSKTFKDKSSKTANKDAAKTLGNIFAQKVKTLGVKAVCFDRGGYKYHGRVKALADGAREGGLEF